MTAPKLAVDRVWKAFGDHVVLADVTLALHVHQVVCLIGPSGSGKSTLLRCVDLLDPVDDGRILLDGVDIAAPEADTKVLRRRLGIVFQQFNLFPHRTVLENVTLAPRRVLGRRSEDADRRAGELLDRFGLADKRERYPEQLSGGQQQRVAIVRALAMDPEVLLLDEVTSALDPELVGEVLDVIRELKHSGITMLIATHEMGFAREIADRVAFLDAGRVVEEGPPRQLFATPEQPRTRAFLQRIISAGRL